jgi:hypothetical protein
MSAIPTATAKTLACENQPPLDFPTAPTSTPSWLPSRAI